MVTPALERAEIRIICFRAVIPLLHWSEAVGASELIAQIALALDQAVLTAELVARFAQASIVIRLQPVLATVRTCIG